MAGVNEAQVKPYTKRQMQKIGKLLVVDCTKTDVPMARSMTESKFLRL